MDKFMQQIREAFANEALWKEFQTGIWDTIYSTVAATLVACVLALSWALSWWRGRRTACAPCPAR